MEELDKEKVYLNAIGDIKQTRFECEKSRKEVEYCKIHSAGQIGWESEEHKNRSSYCANPC